MSKGEKKSIFKKWWFWLIVVVIVGGVAASGSGGGSGNQAEETTKSASDTPTASEQKEETKTADKPRLTLNKGWKIDKSNPYMTFVTGKVSNNSDDPINGYIQITFSALDSEGANVGDCLDNANTVDAKGTWKFKAMCSGEGIETVRFKEITGF